MTQTNQTSLFTRKITTFAHRKNTTKAQKKFLEDYLPLYGLEKTTDFSDFSKIFANNQPVFLEIGFGMGDSLLQEAQENPNINFVGIEVYPAGVGKLLGGIVSNNLQNVRIFKADALDILENSIQDACISQVKVLFPDPWQKARHNKRRIIQDAFIAQIYRILKPNASLIVATDWQDYAEHIAIVLTNSQLKSTNPNGAYSPRYARPITKFEQKAIAEAREVFNFEFVKQ